MYPNPSKGLLYISSNSKEDIQIQVVSLSGQVLNQQKMSGKTMSMDLSNLANGVYMVYAISLLENVVHVQKVVLTR